MVAAEKAESGLWVLNVETGTRKPKAEPYLMVVSDEQRRR